MLLKLAESTIYLSNNLPFKHCPIHKKGHSSPSAFTHPQLPRRYVGEENTARVGTPWSKTSGMKAKLVRISECSDTFSFRNPGSLNVIATFATIHLQAISVDSTCSIYFSNNCSLKTVPLTPSPGLWQWASDLLCYLLLRDSLRVCSSGSVFSLVSKTEYISINNSKYGTLILS